MNRSIDSSSARVDRRQSRVDAPKLELGALPSDRRVVSDRREGPRTDIDLLAQIRDLAHGPSRVQQVTDKAFSYQGDDPFWTQVLGAWPSRHDKATPGEARNWVLLFPCDYLASYDTRRQAIIFEPKS